MVVRHKSGKATAKAKAKAKRDAEQKDKITSGDSASGGGGGGGAANGAANGAAAKKAPLFTRVFNRRAELEPEEYIDAMYWMRQTLGLSLGVVYGLGKVTGQYGISTFLCLSIMFPPSLLRRLHPFDEDEIGKVGSVSTEGLMPSFALFMLTWIIAYTIAL